MERPEPDPVNTHGSEQFWGGTIFFERDRELPVGEEPGMVLWAPRRITLGEQRRYRAGKAASIGVDHERDQVGSRRRGPLKRDPAGALGQWRRRFEQDL